MKPVYRYGRTLESHGVIFTLAQVQDHLVYRPKPRSHPNMLGCRLCHDTWHKDDPPHHSWMPRSKRRCLLSELEEK